MWNKFWYFYQSALTNTVRQQRSHFRPRSRSRAVVATVKCIKYDIFTFKIVSLHFDAVSFERMTSVTPPWFKEKSVEKTTTANSKLTGKKNLSSTFWCEIWCYSFKCFATSNPVIQSDLKLFKDLELIGDNSYLTTGFWSSVCGSKLIFGHCYINFLCPIELQSEVTLPQRSASSVFQIQRSSPGATNKISEEWRREPSGDARSCAFIHNNCAVSISGWLNKGNSLFLPLQRWYVLFCSDFKEQKQAFQAAVVAPTVQLLY